jgi:hypothetical protein
MSVRLFFSLLRISSAALLAALVLAGSGCIRWPGEPYMDVVATPSERVVRIVRAPYPDADFIGPVYRRHIDTRGGDQIAGELFLFKDKSGRLHRGEVDRDSRLTAHPAKFVDKLPDRLQAGFFDGSSAAVPGGRVPGRPWTFAAPDAVYEFQFDSGRGTGFGRISESGSSMSAYHFR